MVDDVQPLHAGGPYPPAARDSVRRAPWTSCAATSSSRPATPIPPPRWRAALRARRARRGRPAPARHVLRGASRPAQAPRAGAGRRAAHRLRARRRRRGPREPLPPRRRPRSRGDAGGARRRARHTVVVRKRRHLLLERERPHPPRRRRRARRASSSSRRSSPTAATREPRPTRVPALREALGLEDDRLEPRGYAALLHDGAGAARPAAALVDAARTRDGPGPRAVLAASPSARRCATSAGRPRRRQRREQRLPAGPVRGGLRARRARRGRRHAPCARSP